MDKPYGPPLNFSRTTASTPGASTWTAQASGELGGDTCLRWDVEVGDTWALEVDAPASNELASTDGREGRAFSLQTNACWDALASFNQSWLSAMLPIIKLDKLDK